jgi:hypothetical protein
MLTLTEPGVPEFRIFPCIFPAEQGSAPRDEFAPGPPTAIESAPAETFRNEPEAIRKIP